MNFRGIILLVLLLLQPSVRPESSHKTENVFLIISDGFRWQEVFNGAEELLMNATNGGVKNTNALRSDFWRDTPEQRREILLPFFWGTIAKEGQLIGNQNKGSVLTVTNGRKFSYPGYNEIITGAPDPRIDSNDKKPNPNTNLFEWLNTRPGYKGKVSVIGTWDAFPYIFNCERSHLPVWPAWENRFAAFEIQVPDAITRLMRDTTPIWEDVVLDSFAFEAAIAHIKAKKPRLLFVGFGETDEWAHAGRYDHYFNSARHMDDFVRRLWETVQSIRQYRDKTTFIITADHGRGAGPVNWKSHGEKVEASEGDWMAVIGPDTPNLGERQNHPPFTQSQIASTIATLLGEDYKAGLPKAAPPIADLIDAKK
jgi:hypothetical protein